MKRTISTDDAPDAVGPYSQATTNGDLLFTAGQVALTPDGEALDDAPVEEQARQALDNLAAILESEGCSMDDVLKTTVFLADMDDYGAVNEVYAEYFEGDPPARSAVAVDELPVGFDVEMEVVADAA
ncbi:reactive intermediate/imine deaminase [Halobacteriales archaeon QS_8_69_26]|nr:MAG: reactive intermediate/imine deaminase [Halobacteriales archaeon QS_8_69_26]